MSPRLHFFVFFVLLSSSALVNAWRKPTNHAERMRCLEVKCNDSFICAICMKLLGKSLSSYSACIAPVDYAMCEPRKQNKW